MMIGDKEDEDADVDDVACVAPQNAVESTQKPPGKE